MMAIEQFEKGQMKKDVPSFQSGDTVRVHTKIREGEKERIQIYEGVVIKRKGKVNTQTFTVRKVSYGVGVERVFPLHSPMVDKIEVKQRGKVRRAKLYYLRDLSGRAARIAEKRDWHVNREKALADAYGTAEENAEPVAETETKKKKEAKK